MKWELSSDLGGKKVRNAEALGELLKSVNVGRRKKGGDDCKEIERSIETIWWEHFGWANFHNPLGC